jgi:hypothetical protein
LVKWGGSWLRAANPLHRWLAYFDKNSPREVVEEALKMDTAIQQFQEKKRNERRLRIGGTMPHAYGVRSSETLLVIERSFQ